MAGQREIRSSMIFLEVFMTLNCTTFHNSRIVLPFCFHPSMGTRAVKQVDTKAFNTRMLYSSKNADN